jgi:hypothetical protein
MACRGRRDKPRRSALRYRAGWPGLPVEGRRVRAHRSQEPGGAQGSQAEIEANGEFTEPDWREVISPDGVRCFVTRFAVPAQARTSPLELPADLSIPDFLRR